MNKIEFGDNREVMKRWAEQGVKVQMCVTSPPYYGLRSYLPDDSASKEFELGDEQTPEEFIENMVDVFRGVRDILADDGVIWVNMGDSYYNYRPGKGQRQSKQSIASQKYSEVEESAKRGRVLEGYKEKDLMGIPWMLAFALRKDGWYLRQDIIWHKPNPMPESVRDRCTKSHEYIFLLSKSEKYFYDNEAIKEPVAASTVSRLSQPTLDEQTGSERVPGKTNGNMKAVGDIDKRNKRSVWTVNTKPYKGAHFATYPPELIEPCILSSTSSRGHCPECGSRWVRVIEKTVGESTDCPKTQSAHEARGGVGTPTGTVGKSGGGRIDGRTTTVGWKPTCECGHEPVPDIVFDPFMGSGTTAGVALRHGRQYMGCELNPEYKDLQTGRIKQVSENKGLEVVDNGDNVVVIDNNLFIIE